MRRLKVGGQVSAGTTFIELDDVKVPVENLIGTEGAAMKYVMQNFNHERLSISVGVNRLARVALSSAFEYCLKREAFSKPLMEQPVVRHRLAKAGGQLEMHWAWIESFCYQMTKLSETEANAKVRNTLRRRLRQIKLTVGSSSWEVLQLSRKQKLAWFSTNVPGVPFFSLEETGTQLPEWAKLQKGFIVKYRERESQEEARMLCWTWQ